MTERPTSPASPMSSTTALSTDDEAVVAAYDTPLEAELARGRLEVEGIAARVADANTVSVAQHLSMALGGVKVVVPKSELEEARAILAAPGALDDDDEDAAHAADAAAAAATRGADADAAAAQGSTSGALRATVVGALALGAAAWLLSQLFG